MSQPYVGEIRMFAGTFDPVGWKFCNGELLEISQYETLFQIIGTTYGGDGESYFALPDLQGRVPVHLGNNFTQAGAGGVESVTLTRQQIPVHSHSLLASTATGSRTNPGGNLSAANPGAVQRYAEDNPGVDLWAATVRPTGGSQPHTNLQPYLCVNFIISLFGLYPTQT